MRKRTVIGVDIDDVLAEFHVSFIKFWNMTYGTQFEKRHFNQANINATWQVPFEELLLRAKAFDAHESRKEIPPRKGSQQMITRLASEYDLHLITKRPVEIRDSTLAWVQQYFPRQFVDAHFCSKDNGLTNTHAKSAICKRIGAPILLEDHLYNTKDCAENGIHVYLFDQPWNQEELPPLAAAVIRVSCWEDSKLETLFQLS